MAQLGAGLVGSGQISYPDVIDSYQTFLNSPNSGPDSAYRVDAEVLMDILKTLVSIETTLGANIQGVFGSLAARLNQFVPGSGGQPGIITFTNTADVAIPGTTHNVGQAALLWQIYDNNIPAHALDPGVVTMQVEPPTYDVFLTLASPMSGLIALGATSPLYITPFTNTTTVSVPGTTHQLGTSDLVFKVYDNGTPRRTATEPGSLTVDQNSHDVVMTFGTAQSGILVLSAGGPAYAANFNLTTPPYTITIPGSTHRLGTRAILFQFYDDGTPRAALGPPDVSVNPSTFDVVITFGVPLSGRLVLQSTSTNTGRDFDIRDSGVVNSSAVRVFSNTGILSLQSGTGQRIYLNDKAGSHTVTVDTQNTRVGIGTAAPTHQLELTAADAVMPGGGPWLAPSDAQQKEHIRPFADGLEVLLQICPVLFRYNGKGGVPKSRADCVGVLGQAMQQIAPYMVRTHKRALSSGETATDLLLFDGQALPYLMINAIKELHQENQRLTAQLAAVEARLARVEERWT